jgi:hypothetical protein
MRTPLRRAYETGDNATVLREIRSRSAVSESGCWLWQGRMKDGYPQLTIGDLYLQAHRVALEASIGKRLGSQAAHHKCATPQCVNPDHLQPVTHRENAAEMLQRRAYLARIRELEDALRRSEPDHPLLRLVSVA